MCVYKRLHKLPETKAMLESQTYKNFDFHIWDNSGSRNVGGIGRFIKAQELVNKYDYVIFIDDDQTFNSTFIQDMLQYAKPKTIAGWYAWKLNGSYFNRVPATVQADYVGTGGMIIPMEAFKSIDLRSIPERYKYIEDLWLCYVCKYKLGYSLERAYVDMKFMKGEQERDQFRTRNLRELKEEFYHHLNHHFNVT